MGGIQEDVGIPHGVVMHRGLTLKGKCMYERSDSRSLMKIVEAGLLRLGGAEGKGVKQFRLEEWDRPLLRQRRGRALFRSLFMIIFER